MDETRLTLVFRRANAGSLKAEVSQRKRLQNADGVSQGRCLYKVNVKQRALKAKQNEEFQFRWKSRAWAGARDDDRPGLMHGYSKVNSTSMTCLTCPEKT